MLGLRQINVLAGGDRREREHDGFGGGGGCGFLSLGGWEAVEPGVANSSVLVHKLEPFLFRSIRGGFLIFLSVLWDECSIGIYVCQLRSPIDNL